MFRGETFAQAVSAAAYLLNTFTNFAPVKTDRSSNNTP